MTVPPVGRAPRLPDLLAELVRDLVVRLQLLGLAVLIAVYALPLVSAESLAAYSSQWLCVPFMILPVVACLRGLGSLSPSERLFWRILAVSFGSWLAALVTYGAVPDNSWGSPWDITVNALYLSFYITFLLAIDLRPDLPPAGAVSRLDRWLRGLGISAFVVCWMLYAVVVPDALSGDAAKRLVMGSVWYVVLDVTIIARLLVTWRTAASGRWRWLYGGLCVASVALLGTDALNVLDAHGLVRVSSPDWTDPLWALPGTLFVAAVVLRRLEFPPGPPSGRTRVSDDARPIRIGTYLVLGGISFPVVNTILLESGVISLSDAELVRVERLVVVGSLIVMSSLAIVAYWMLEGHRARMLRERRALEAQLLQAQKMEAVGRLAGGVAHDFNNLLTAITGYNDLALEGLEKSDPRRSALEEVRAAASRASALTRQLLAFSRRQIIRTERLDLNQVVSQLERMLRRLIGEDIRLETRLAAGLAPVVADRSQIEQVLMNLTVNARDAMPKGGVLTIATAHVAAEAATNGRSAPAPAVEIRVADTGVGIPDDILPYIFEPFFTTKDADKGTGLGLATAYGIVAQAGGTIGVTSEQGLGTEFTIRLPSVAEAAETTDTARGAAADVPVAQGVETVLLVEDEPVVRELTRRMLEGSGYAVVTAASGDEALRAHAAHLDRFDLLLTDLVLPGMNGRALAERLCQARPALRVLLMTGYTDDAVVRHGLQDGRYTILQKPFTKTTLAMAVRSVLDGRAVPGRPAPQPAAAGTSD